MQSSFPGIPEPVFVIAVDWPDETTLHIRIRGGLDMYTVPEAKQTLLEQLERRPRQTIIDLGEGFVDSCGLSLLIHLAQRIRSEGLGLRVVYGERLGHLLRVTGLEDRVADVGKRADTMRGL